MTDQSCLHHQSGGHGAAGTALRIGGVGGDHIAHRGLVVAGRHAGAAAGAGQKSLTPFHKTFLLSFRIRSVLPIWERCKWLYSIYKIMSSIFYYFNRYNKKRGGLLIEKQPSGFNSVCPQSGLQKSGMPHDTSPLLVAYVGAAGGLSRRWCCCWRYCCFCRTYAFAFRFSIESPPSNFLWFLLKSL